MFDALANHIEFALKRSFIFDISAAADENLLEGRLSGFGGLSQQGVVCRYLAPPQDLLAFFFHHLVEPVYARLLLVRIGGQEYHAGTVVSEFRQCDPQFTANPGKELVRQLCQHAHAVTGIFLAAAGSPMHQVLEDGEGMFDDSVRFAALDIDHESHPARIMLGARLVQTLRRNLVDTHDQ